MNWTTITNTVASLAPALGQALAGPAGHVVGQAIASTLGVNNSPDAVETALKTDPKAAVKLAELETELKRATLEATTRQEENQLKAQTAQRQAINTTMQAELQNGNTYKSGWRSAIGWTMAFSFGWISLILGISVFQDPSQIANVVDAIVMLTVSMGAVLGINIRHMSSERLASLGFRPTSLMDSLMTRSRGSH
ncbi:3TM-type holin [Larsenimonas suaedae]|uniref:3TM-type holin n=1 Tax=Larsenimonas suaedae TaxID=1851019 RepID=A0ABU1GV67_9GAMM|nr:3TM-type holin [Larsenimonas suaedae]MCM2971706.1 holin family protein [Larsenimonas suaedae]MDR5895258.1 3TM-type holin [Larsenimonas suaedae]